MVTREECEMVRMVFVTGHYNRNGDYIRAYCREKTRFDADPKQKRDVAMRNAVSFGSDYQFIQADYDIENILESIGVPEDEQRDITGAFIKTKEGNYSEVWVTRGNSYDINSYYERVK